MGQLNKLGAMRHLANLVHKDAAGRCVLFGQHSYMSPCTHGLNPQAHCPAAAQHRDEAENTASLCAHTSLCPTKVGPASSRRAQPCPPGQVTQAHQAAVHRDAAALRAVPRSQQPLLDDHLATQGQHSTHIPLLLLQADDQVLVEGGCIRQEGPEGALDLYAWWGRCVLKILAAAWNYWGLQLLRLLAWNHTLTAAQHASDLPAIRVALEMAVLCEAIYLQQFGIGSAHESN